VILIATNPCITCYSEPFFGEESAFFTGDFHPMGNAEHLLPELLRKLQLSFHARPIVTSCPELPRIRVSANETLFSKLHEGQPLQFLGTDLP
jgi:hypothetical protein